MNWDAIGAMGEWAGAVAVVVTLFYLAMQVRQSNVVALAEAERDFWTGWHGVVNRVGFDLEAASRFQHGLHDYRSLSQPEKLVFHTQMCGPFNQAEIAVQLNAKGLLTKFATESVLDNVVSLILTQGGADWWEECGQGFAVYSQIEDWRKREDRKIAPANQQSVFESEASG
jgi:hypothetical protein